MDKDQIIEQQRQAILELVHTIIDLQDQMEDAVLMPWEKER